jgi:hypothetical protein
MRYGAPYCLVGSGFVNSPFIAGDSMLTAEIMFITVWIF